MSRIHKYSTNKNPHAHPPPFTSICSPLLLLDQPPGAMLFWVTYSSSLRPQLFLSVLVVSLAVSKRILSIFRDNASTNWTQQVLGGYVSTQQFSIVFQSKLVLTPQLAV